MTAPPPLIRPDRPFPAVTVRLVPHPDRPLRLLNVDAQVVIPPRPGGGEVAGYAFRRVGDLPSGRLGLPMATRVVTDLFDGVVEAAIAEAARWWIDLDHHPPDAEVIIAPPSSPMPPGYRLTHVLGKPSNVLEAAAGPDTAAATSIGTSRWQEIAFPDPQTMIRVGHALVAAGLAQLHNRATEADRAENMPNPFALPPSPWDPTS